MEALEPLRLTDLDDSVPILGDPEQLRERVSRDGFLFFRELLPRDLVLGLRQRVLDYAMRIGWLDPTSPIGEAYAAAGKRIGEYQNPDWVNLQVEVQNRPEMWALGECAIIHRILSLVDTRSSYLCLSSANTVRAFSAHPDLVTRPHQDAHYVRFIEDFWTAWIPLGDCPKKWGPLALCAGSHLNGLQPHVGDGVVGGGVTVPQDTVWSSTDFICGDIVLFRPFTLHRSLPNLSQDRLRLSADFRYGFWSDSEAVDWRLPKHQGSCS